MAHIERRHTTNIVNGKKFLGDFDFATHQRAKELLIVAAAYDGSGAARLIVLGRCNQTKRQQRRRRDYCGQTKISHGI
jgi:hypothetical protein